MAAKKKKRTLTAKQIAAGFGGKKKAKASPAGEMGWGGFGHVGTKLKKGRKKGKRKAKRGGHVPLPILKRRLAKLSAIVKSRS